MWISLINISLRVGHFYASQLERKRMAKLYYDRPSGFVGPKDTRVRGVPCTIRSQSLNVKSASNTCHLKRRLRRG